MPSMKYLSTRGGDERLTFEQAVLRGLAPNGGLYIPAHLPHLPENWHSEWSKLSFTELALELYSLFIPEREIPRDDLKDLIDRSYSTFRHEQIAPLHRTGEKEFILELFHGPTFAFKDVALQFLGNLFEYFLKRRNEGKEDSQRERLTVVGATSGDTGSAAIYGLRSKQDISIFILHPKGRVSPIQEAQMTTVPDENVFNLAVNGTFDDCQDIVKLLFNDMEFNSTYHLGAVNSINWARILAQTVYYFSAYFQVQHDIPYDVLEPKIQFAVPTGNFGDILAGYYAKHLGLPIDKLVIATNANDILARFWKTGRYEKADSGEPEEYSDDEGANSEENPHGAIPHHHHRYPSLTEDEAFQQEDVVRSQSQQGFTRTPSQQSQQPQTLVANGSADGKQATASAKASGGTVAETLSPAMDILVSSNFERLLFYLALEGTTAGAVAADGEVDGGQAARVRMAAENVKVWPNLGNNTKGYQTLESPTVEGPAQQPSNNWKGFFNVYSYTQYFDVDTDVVLNRLMSSLYPTSGDFFNKIDANPDLYGLVWICTTLVFVLASLGNCATYLVKKRTDSNAPWIFDVNYMNLAASIIYGYAIIVPLGFYFALRYMGSKADLLRFWCLWGYSLFIFVPTSLPLLIPVEFLRWVIILLAGSASSCFVALNLRSYLETNNDITVVMAAAFGLQMVLSIFIKVWFFP